LVTGSFTSSKTCTCVLLGDHVYFCFGYVHYSGMLTLKCLFLCIAYVYFSSKSASLFQIMRTFHPKLCMRIVVSFVLEVIT
jgi:hypothetical protein